MTTLQDTHLGVTATVAERLADINARHRANRKANYSRIESAVSAVCVLAMLGLMLFVWAA